MARHPGIWKTWQAIWQDYWWPTLRDFVIWYIKGCAKCQQSKTIHKCFQPPLQPISLKGDATPFSTVAMDFVVKLPKSKGSNSILTVTDQGCTKAIILVPYWENIGSLEITELFKERVFLYTAIPKQFILDRDTRFTFSLFKKLCQALEVEQKDRKSVV